VASIEPTKKGPNGKSAKGTKWTVRYRDPNGRSREKTFARKVDAEAFGQQVGVDMRSGEWVDPRLRRMLFDDWAEAWWRTTVKLAPLTRRGYWCLLHNHVLPFFGGRRLGEVDFMDVEEFIADRLEAGLSPKMVRKATSVVSLVMESAVRAKARRDNPARGHRIPQRQRKIGTGDVLDMPQLRRLVDHVRDPYKPAVWLLVLTGMRPSELAGLRVQDLDLLRRRITVAGSLVAVEAYGDVPATLSEGPPKTAAGHRTIPIPAWLCEMVGETVGRRSEGRLPLGPDERVFVGVSGRPLDTKWFRQGVMLPALRAAGLPESIRTYDLRHSHASLLIDQGANVVAVAQRLGHTDPAMTLRVYAHLFEGLQEQLTDALDALVQSTAATPELVSLDNRRAASVSLGAPHKFPTLPHRTPQNAGQSRSLTVDIGQPK
jgi:integrase